MVNTYAFGPYVIFSVFDMVSFSESVGGAWNVVLIGMLQALWDMAVELQLEARDKSSTKLFPAYFSMADEQVDLCISTKFILPDLLEVDALCPRDNLTWQILIQFNRKAGSPHLFITCQPRARPYVEERVIELHPHPKALDKLKNPSELDVSEEIQELVHMALRSPAYYIDASDRYVYDRVATGVSFLNETEEEAAMRICKYIFENVGAVPKVQKLAIAAVKGVCRIDVDTAALSALEDAVKAERQTADGGFVMAGSESPSSSCRRAKKALVKRAPKSCSNTEGPPLGGHVSFAGDRWYCARQ